MYKKIESQDEEHYKGLSRVVEWLHGDRIKLLLAEDKSEIINLVSAILERDGTHEVNRLILENRLPIIMGPDGYWYTDEDYAEDNIPTVVTLLLCALIEYRSTIHQDGKPSFPEYDLRLSLSLAVLKRLNQLLLIERQLDEEGIFSDEITRAIMSLKKLNTALPFSREQLSEILN